MLHLAITTTSHLLPPIHNINLHKPLNPNPSTLNFPTKPLKPNFPTLTKTLCTTTTTSNPEPPDPEFEFQIEEPDEGSPWEGAIMYKRNAGVPHLEYCTTLERLGLGRLSSEVSKARAKELGIRIVKGVKGDRDGTPVMVSVDVCRRKDRIRLDGIVRTVISLNCNKCGEPAGQSIYSDFSLLLCEEPIQEPDTINLGTIFGEDKSRSFAGEDVDDDDSLIDPDDQLYFPVDEKVIDISKNIRDLIHIEITISAVCGPNCKGLCLNCGTNLNISKCTCRTSNVEKKSYGPLGDLRKQMQQK